jgi:hypothetical protein
MAEINVEPASIIRIFFHPHNIYPVPVFLARSLWVVVLSTQTTATKGPVNSNFNCRYLFILLDVFPKGISGYIGSVPSSMNIGHSLSWKGEAFGFKIERSKDSGDYL